MVINIGNGFDQYCVKLILEQNKESDTAIDWHEKEIAGEVIVDNTADFIGKGVKTKYIHNQSDVWDYVDTFQPCVICRPGIGLRFFNILWQNRWHNLGYWDRYGLYVVTLCFGFLACASYPFLWTCHVSFCHCRAWIQIFGDQVFGEIGVLFQETFS